MVVHILWRDGLQPLSFDNRLVMFDDELGQQLRRAMDTLEPMHANRLPDVTWQFKMGGYIESSRLELDNDGRLRERQ